MDSKWAVALVLPMAASVASAFISSRYAGKARQAEAEASRLRQLEDQNSERKYEMYRPMLEVFGDVLTPGRSEAASVKMEEVLPTFMTFVTMFGSDEVVKAFFRFRAASTGGEDAQPPAEITMRLISDFLVAARKDIAAPGTKLTGLEVLGMRINDIYSEPEYLAAFTLPLEELVAIHGWTPPWSIQRGV